MESKEDKSEFFSSFEIFFLSNADYFNSEEYNHERNSSDENSLNLGESIIEKNKDNKQEQFIENEDYESYEILRDNLVYPSEKISQGKLVSLTENNQDPEKNNTNKKNKFIILNKKRGRKVETPKKKIKEHSKDASDNILKKIKVHFLSFLIDLANDVKNSQLKKIKNDAFFQQINYKTKCSIKLKNLFKCDYKYENIFFNYNISLNRGIKRKNKNYIEQEMTNEKNYEKIIEQYPLLKSFFEQKIKDIFKNYYCKNKKDINNNFDFNGTKIALSPKTKALYDLLDKDENKDSKDKFKNIIIKYFKCNL